MTNASAAALDSLKQARIIAFALFGGPLGFAVVTWIITEGGTSPMGDPEALPGTLLLWGWVVLALAAFGGALMLQGRVAQASAEARRRGVAPNGKEALSKLIIAWALVEGVALAGTILFLLTGMVVALGLAVLVLVAGMALTLPKEEWFG